MLLSDEGKALSWYVSAFFPFIIHVQQGNSTDRIIQNKSYHPCKDRTGDMREEVSTRMCFNKKLKL